MVSLSGAGQHSRTHALIVLTDNANKILADSTSTKQQKEDALIDMMALGWAPMAVKAIRDRPLNKLPKRIQNEVFDKEEYILSRDMIIFSTDDGVSLEHTQRNLWRELMVRFHLFEITDMRHWVALVAHLDTKGLRTPMRLQRVPFSELLAVGWQLEHPDMLVMLWQAARSDASAHTMSLLDKALVSPEAFHALILSLRHESIRDTDTVPEYEEMRRGPAIHPDFDELSASNKRSALSRTGLGQFRILKLLDLGAKRNTPRSFAGSLRPAASGMQNYLNFCQFLGRTPFPVDTDTVLLRSAMFRPGRTFGQYIAHLMKAVILLRQPTDSLTPDVRSVPRGLKNAQDMVFRFRNFILVGDLPRLLRTPKLTSAFGQAAFLSFLFLIRVPSEALVLIRADSTDRISEFPLSALRRSWTSGL